MVSEVVSERRQGTYTVRGRTESRVPRFRSIFYGRTGVKKKFDFLINRNLKSFQWGLLDYWRGRGLGPRFNSQKRWCMRRPLKIKGKYVESCKTLIHNWIKVNKYRTESVLRSPRVKTDVKSYYILKIYYDHIPEVDLV